MNKYFFPRIVEIIVYLVGREYIAFMRDILTIRF